MILIQNAIVQITTENKQVYTHSFVTEVAIDNPREKILSSPSVGTGIGVEYSNNVFDSIKTTFTIREMEKGTVALYDKLFRKSNQRIDVLIIDAMTGEKKEFFKSIVTKDIRATKITEGKASIDTVITISTPQNHFNSVEAEED